MFECYHCKEKYDLIKLKDNGTLLGVIVTYNGVPYLYCFNEDLFNTDEEFLINEYAYGRITCDVCRHPVDYRTKQGKYLNNIVYDAFRNRKNYRWF